MSKHSLKVLCETLPGVLFFFLYACKVQLTFDGHTYTPLQTATMALMIGAVIAAAAAYIALKRLPAVPLFTAAAALLFGGMTLIWQDDSFIKLKPTVVNGLFAVGLWISVICKRPAAKLLLGDAVPLTPADTRLFTLRWALFFASMARKSLSRSPSKREPARVPTLPSAI